MIFGDEGKIFWRRFFAKITEVKDGCWREARFLFGGVRFKIEVEANVFGLFIIEIFVDGGFDLFVEVSDADGFGFGVGGVFRLDEWGDVADFRLDADAVAVFLGGGAGVDGGGTLEIAESVAHGFVTTTQNPVDDFAFAHDVEVVEGEVAAVDHGLHHVAEELESSARFVAMVFGREGEIFSSELSGDGWSSEGDFFKVVFVFNNDEVGIEAFNIVESPSVKEEKTVF